VRRNFAGRQAFTPSGAFHYASAHVRPDGNPRGNRYPTNMHLISRRIHGVLDYVVGAVLIGSPKLFGFDSGGMESRVPVFLGAATLVYSIFTHYEAGLVKVLPFRVHLWLDVVSGILLAASPWLFGFYDRTWVPHVALGGGEMAAALMTNRTSRADNPSDTGSPVTSRTPDLN
jgi:hypothetical protein